jgi:catechol 2,3-dioxygenase-like lactoylglutathione lyase family enzyme
VRLDHVVVSVRDLDTAMRDYAALGFHVLTGGVHAAGTTHNALICFADGSYIELLAPTGEPPRPAAVDFSPMLGGEGLAGWALLCDDIASTAQTMRAQGKAVGAIIDGERLRPDGVRLVWKLALIDGGFRPFLIQDVTPRSLRVPGDEQSITQANGVLGMAAPPKLRGGVWQPLRLIVAAPVPAFDSGLTHGVDFALEAQSPR